MFHQGMSQSTSGSMQQGLYIIKAGVPARRNSLKKILMRKWQLFDSFHPYEIAVSRLITVHCWLLTKEEIHFHGYALMMMVSEPSPPSTKQLTVEMKPLRKELNGKVPTRQQYTNWMTAVRNTYRRYASMIFSFLGVFALYSWYSFGITEASEVIFVF